MGDFSKWNLVVVRALSYPLLYILKAPSCHFPLSYRRIGWERDNGRKRERCVNLNSEGAILLASTATGGGIQRDRIDPKLSMSLDHAIPLDSSFGSFSLGLWFYPTAQRLSWSAHDHHIHTQPHLSISVIPWWKDSSSSSPEKIRIYPSTSIK